MRWLEVAWWAEGPSDEYLLVPILERAVERWLRLHARGPAEFRFDREEPDATCRGFVDCVVSVCERAASWAHLVLVHTDAGSASTLRAHQQRVTPALQALSARRLLAGRVLGVVPARESEAWLLVDAQAIRTAAGNPRGRANLGIPANARHVARVIDPKRALRQAVEAALGRASALASRRAVYDHIAHHVSLERLDSVAAFAQFTTEIDRALRGLGWP